MPVLPEFSPAYQQGNPIDTFYKAQDQRMSMMERAQRQRQNELVLQELEQKKLEWDVEAPLRRKKAEVEALETGAKYFTASQNLDSEKQLAANWPAITQKINEAQVNVKFSDGSIDYESSIQKWSDLAADLSKYQGSTRGKQAYDMAVMQLNQSKVLHGDQLKYKIQEEKAKNTLRETIVEGRLVKLNPATGETAEEKGAYPDAMQSFDIEKSKAAGKKAGELGVIGFDKLIETGKSSAANLAKLRMERQVMTSVKDQMGARFNIEYGLRSVGQAFGWGDDKTLSDMQQLKRINYDKQLNEASRLKGQGSITENERVILAGAINNPNMTYEANMAILNVFEKIYKRDSQKAELALELQQNNPKWTPDRINIEIAKWELRPENQLDLTDVYHLQGGAGTSEPNSWIDQRRSALKQKQQ